MSDLILMPELSSGMERGLLARWLVAEGDEVAQGTALAEVETDKATLEIEAERSGRVGALLVAAGTEVAVGAPVLQYLGADGRLTAFAIAAAREPEVAPAPVIEGRGIAAPLTQRVIAAPLARRVIATPLARRMARDIGIGLEQLQGSGPRGRIVRADIERHQARPPATPLVAPAQPPVAAPLGAALAGPGRPHQRSPLDTMRRTIARRLTEAKQTVPHFYLRRQVRMTGLLALRAQLNDPALRGPAPRISVNDMVVRAHALALRDVPAANAALHGDEILSYRHVDVAVAVSVSGGLITPVLRDAELKSVSAIAAELADLATRARARRLSPEEYQGGTTSVSNLGMYGVEDFDAILNPPQATILAVGACTDRALAGPQGLELAAAMTVSLSADHRVVDGAVAAETLARFAHYIETPLALIA